MSAPTLDSYVVLIRDRRIDTVGPFETWDAGLTWAERWQQAGTGPRGVKITHKPTGLIAISDSSRSQHRNRQVALAMIEGGLTYPQFRA